jgi:hypothetical protein
MNIYYRVNKNRNPGREKELSEVHNLRHNLQFLEPRQSLLL